MPRLKTLLVVVNTNRAYSPAISQNNRAKKNSASDKTRLASIIIRYAESLPPEFAVDVHSAI